jgi:PTS system nitrogen regulatory IIA component
MTIQEAAAMLGADARRIERMAQRGEIPCRKVGGRLRFNRAELTEWLQQTMGTMSHSHLAQVEAGMTQQLRVEAVSTNLGSRTKHSTLRELVALAAQTGLVLDRQSVLDAVVRREELRSTAMEGGMAIPHPGRPLPDALAEPVLAVARTSHGIVFGAPDGRLTTLFFLTTARDDQHHLHTLARLCRMLRDNSFVTQLAEAQDAGEMSGLMKERERQVICESG